MAVETEENRPALSADKRFEQICTNIRSLDQNSFRLLAFVPLVSGGTILGVLFKKELNSAAILMIFFISIAGALVTFGLFGWELRNIEICRSLQTRADAMEQRDGGVTAPEAQFAERVLNAPVKNRLKIRQRIAEAIIYVTTILAWLALPWVVMLSR